MIKPQHWNEYMKQKAAGLRKTGPRESTLLLPSLDDNKMRLSEAFADSDDLILCDFTQHGYRFLCVSMENMVDKNALGEQVIEKILEQKQLPSDPEERFEFVNNEVLTAPDRGVAYEYETACTLLMGGNALLLCDGFGAAITFSMQDYAARSVSEPGTEVAERGSREGFVEVLRNNMAMIRRRMKTTDMTFEIMEVGEKSHTEIALCYLKSAVPQNILKEVKKRLSRVSLPVVLESGYLQPYLEDRPLSLFSSVGVSERPDTVCGKITEGRIAVLVDGTPFCLLVPHLFSEYFQSLDDYSLHPYFVTLVRFLKYVSFLLSILLPGMYVAVGEYNPEMLPSALFYKVIDSESVTPFPLMTEALIIHIIYEIMREAGLRLPQSIGHAVSIVGALVVGDAAVTAGLIGAPMVMVVAVTALSSYVLPDLYYPTAVLRFICIFAGGFAGLYGVVLLFCGVLVTIFSVNPMGIPLGAPIAPFDRKAMRDTFLRSAWPTLQKYTVKIQNLSGTEPVPSESDVKKR